jgi:hypothetical protein
LPAKTDRVSPPPTPAGAEKDQHGVPGAHSAGATQDTSGNDVSGPVAMSHVGAGPKFVPPMKTVEPPTVDAFTPRARLCTSKTAPLTVSITRTVVRRGGVYVIEFSGPDELICPAIVSVHARSRPTPGGVVHEMLVCATINALQIKGAYVVPQVKLTSAVFWPKLSPVIVITSPPSVLSEPHKDGADEMSVTTGAAYATTALERSKACCGDPTDG